MLTNLRNLTSAQKILGGISVILLLCCGCLSLIFFTLPSDEETDSNVEQSISEVGDPTKEINETREVIPTAIVEPSSTSTPSPISTPNPTNTATPDPTSAPIQTDTPEPTEIPHSPTPTIQPLDVRFSRQDTGGFDWFTIFVSSQKIRLTFDLEGENAGVTDCEALGDGLIFREEIPLRFVLTITQPNGDVIFDNKDASISGSGAGYTCHLEIQNETGISAVEDFEGSVFTIVIFSEDIELDAIRLKVSDSKLVSEE